MKTLIKALTITTVSILTGSILYGPKEAATLAKTLVSDIRQTVDEATSDAQQIKAAKIALTDDETRLTNAEASLNLSRNRARKAAADVVTAEDCVKISRSRLQALQPVLKGEVATFVLNGITHSRAEAETEARRLLGVLEGHQKELKLKTAISEQLKATIAGSEKLLAEARLQLDSDKARLAEAEVKLTVNNIAKELATPVGGLAGTRNRIMDELAKRVEVSDAQLFAASAVKNAGNFAWDAEVNSVVSAVDAAVGTAPAKPAEQLVPEPAKPEAPKPTAETKSSPAPVPAATSESAKPAVTRAEAVPGRFVSVPAVPFGSRVIVSSCGRY